MGVYVSAEPIQDRSATLSRHSLAGACNLTISTQCAGQPIGHK